MRLLRREQVQLVIGFGGYVSIPVGLAALVRGVPLVLHEQNSVPGMANKFLSKWARAVGVTYPESASLLAHQDRVCVTGNPVRDEVLGATRENGREAMGLAEDDLVLLVFGGSRGARHINSAIVSLRDRLVALPDLVVIHLAGALEAASVRDALDAGGGDADGRWRVIDYLDDMGSAIAASDLVIARAGATSIAELTVLGAPTVLVPYPYATDDHQTKNAEAMRRHGAAVVVADARLDSDEFSTAVFELLGDPARRATMSAASRELGRPDAAELVVAMARQTVPSQDGDTRQCAEHRS